MNSSLIKCCAVSFMIFFLFQMSCIFDIFNDTKFIELFSNDNITIIGDHKTQYKVSRVKLNIILKNVFNELYNIYLKYHCDCRDITPLTIHKYEDKDGVFNDKDRIWMKKMHKKIVNYIISHNSNFQIVKNLRQEES